MLRPLLDVFASLPFPKQRYRTSRPVKLVKQEQGKVGGILGTCGTMDRMGLN
jgi:hypothetical protein